MRQSVLYKETKCTHGYMRTHTVSQEFHSTELNDLCLGGSREEFTVDRRAALKVFRDAGYNIKGLPILLDQAIDASLGIVEPF